MITPFHRVHQGFAALLPEAPPNIETILTSALTPPQAAAFRELPVHDQAHLCRVYEAMHAAGTKDRDLLTAALFHDLGKHSPDGSVRLIHRVARVLLGRCSTRLLNRLARLPASGWRHGLALAVHHPRLGARRARALGCSSRTCWLIAHHEDRCPSSDPALNLLISIDQATP